MSDYTTIAKAFIDKNLDEKWRPTHLPINDDTLTSLLEAATVIGRRVICQNFEIDAVARPAYVKAITHIVIADLQTNVRKGLYIYGKAGCGKTAMMKIVSMLAHAVNKRNNHAMYSAIDVVQSYTKDGPHAYVKLQLTKGTLCLDDVGSEPTEAGYYGTKVPVIAGLIDMRYRLWCREGRWTHFTSNFDLDWIENALGYGPREADRIKEMCHVIKMDGDSRRK